MRHKHADLIIAWANGAEIQSYSPVLKEWVTEKPYWSDDVEFRIKPKELPKIPEGFIPYTDVHCPVDDSTRVEVLFSAGAISAALNAGAWAWGYTAEGDEGHQIIAYRVIEKEKKQITRWKWAIKSDQSLPWQETSVFYTEEEAKTRITYSVFKKLDYTKTEFDE